jgi:hypothetical protein
MNIWEIDTIELCGVVLFLVSYPLIKSLIKRHQQNKHCKPQ